jgi:hypothetical protein
MIPYRGCHFAVVVLWAEWNRLAASGFFSGLCGGDCSEMGLKGRFCNGCVVGVLMGPGFRWKRNCRARGLYLTAGILRRVGGRSRCGRAPRISRLGAKAALHATLHPFSSRQDRLWNVLGEMRVGKGVPAKSRTRDFVVRTRTTLADSQLAHTIDKWDGGNKHSGMYSFLAQSQRGCGGGQPLRLRICLLFNRHLRPLRSFSTANREIFIACRQSQNHS